MQYKNGPNAAMESLLDIPTARKVIVRPMRQTSQISNVSFNSRHSGGVMDDDADEEHGLVHTHTLVS